MLVRSLRPCGADVSLTAAFTLGHRTVQVDGFYDGAGVYKIRFMPDTEGSWSWTTQSSAPTLAGRTGAFTCTPALPGSHGPVGVRGTRQFAHADTPGPDPCSISTGFPSRGPTSW